MAGAEAFTDPGHGPPARVAVLCLHGLTSTPQTIRPVAEHLAGRGHRVHAPRLPGHGTTLRAMALTRYDDWLAAAESALIRLRADIDPAPDQPVERVVIVGISLGGALAADLAIRHPDLVEALVLINPAFAATDPRLRVLPVLKYLAPTTAGLAGNTVDPDAEPEIAYPRLPLHAFASFVERWPGLLERAEQIDCPVLLVSAAHDEVVPMLSSDLFAARIEPHLLQRVTLAHSAHVATLDQEAGLLSEYTAAFIDEVTG